jgi:hypothetical protein
MAILTWNNSGERYFETGIEKGVLYIDDIPAKIWPGLTSVTINPLGGEVESNYFDGIKYQNIVSKQEFSCVIKAYSFPYEFNRCLGIKQIEHEGLNASQQTQEFFNVSYQTKIGNDTSGINKGYKLHLIYNAIPTISDNTFDSISNKITATPFSINVSTINPLISGSPVSSYRVIDSTKYSEEIMTQITDILYGTENMDARFPTPFELLTILGG